jgi:hypothetical protein
MKHSAGDDRSRPGPPRPRKPISPLPKKAARAIDRVVRVREKVFLANAKCARAAWGVLPKIALHALRELAEKYALSVAAGDLLYLDGRWYVTHAGLLRLANRHRCASIQVQPLAKFCEPTSNRWVFRATVYKTSRSNGFVGYGDADPSNVSLLVRGAEMRVAETRAVNRALRKAYGIGLCSIEELGAFRGSSPNTAFGGASKSQTVSGNGSNHGQPRLRDRLCLLIRQHQLDPALVKRYAAEFCGTEALREAGRERVEAFVNHVAEWATRDRDGLVCKLNSFSQTEEGNR